MYIISTKAAESAGRLQFEMQKHKDKMALAKDADMDAADVERIANG